MRPTTVLRHDACPAATTCPQLHQRQALHTFVQPLTQSPIILHLVAQLSCIQWQRECTSSCTRFATPAAVLSMADNVQGGDLFQYVKKRGGLREHEARWFFQQLIIGMDYSHQMGVVNRDIKACLPGQHGIDIWWC